MPDLTPNTGWHDDATSKRHRIDKEAKARRQLTEWRATPALAREAGSRIVDGILSSSISGFSFFMKDGQAEKAEDAAAYTQAAIAMSRDRARYKRIRERDGGLRTDYGQYKHGAVSLVSTVAPWAVATISRLSPQAREELLLHLAEVQAKEIERISGRPTFGGGVHFDSAVPHWHLHIPKTDEEGGVYPKHYFLTAGPWTVGSWRIQQKFPELLTSKKRDMLQSNLAKKDMAHVVDIACARVTDEAFEQWVREKGKWKKYAEDCREYTRRKIKAQNEEKHKRLMSASLERFAEAGIWPLAYSAMRYSMWRMIPREVRPAIFVAVRAYQIIHAPVRLGIKAVLHLSETMPRKREINIT